MPKMQAVGPPVARVEAFWDQPILPSGSCAHRLHEGVSFCSTWPGWQDHRGAQDRVQDPVWKFTEHDSGQVNDYL